jgi:hypothetical protein
MLLQRGLTTSTLAVVYVQLHEVQMGKRSAAVWFLTLVTTVCTACGGAPTSPAPVQPLPFRAGGYVLNVWGGTIECNDLAVPQAGTDVTVLVTLTADRGGWIGRPTTPGGGNFQLRLSGIPGQQSLIKSSLTGTFSGTAVDSFSFPDSIAPTGTRADFNPPGSFSGEVESTGFFTEGVISSAVSFSRNSRSVTRPAGEVRLSMTPWVS